MERKLQMDIDIERYNLALGCRGKADFFRLTYFFAFIFNGVGLQVLTTFVTALPPLPYKIKYNKTWQEINKYIVRLLIVNECKYQKHKF